MEDYKNANILLVEDNQMDIELTLDAFRENKLGNRIDVVTSGQDALDYLFGKGKYENRVDFPLPGIIMLDLKMPGIDGHEVLKEVKGAPVLKRIPIIILTSSKEEGDLHMSYDNGANSYLIKPISFKSLLIVIKKIGEYWLMLNVKL